VAALTDDNETWVEHWNDVIPLIPHQTAEAMIARLRRDRDGLAQDKARRRTRRRNRVVHHVAKQPKNTPHSATSGGHPDIHARSMIV
jgi:hypothetical protein